MAKPRDYYEVLGVNRGANADQIRSAYRKLARKFHPDVNKAADATKQFAEVQEAYDILSDQEKRTAYDQFGHAGIGPGSGPRGSERAWGAAGNRRQAQWSSVEPGDFQGGDFSGIFEQIFGGAAGGASPFGGRGGRTAGVRSRSQPSQPASPPQRGQDIEHTITITFLTSVFGGSEQLRFGVDGSASTISVKIPPGIDSGAKLRIKGKGQAGPPGGQNGDIILTVQVGKHPTFRREGLDLFIDLPITIAEAVIGATVQVPLLTPQGADDRFARIKVPPGASSGRKLRLQGKGIVDANEQIGDYYAEIQIAAPAITELSEDGRRLITQLASELKNPRESSP